MRLSKWLSRRSKSRIPSRWLGVENLEDRSVPAAFTAGNLLVYRVGDGSSALTNSATAAFLDEYTPSGALVQSIAVPVADSGTNFALTNAGSATSEGYLTLSTDGAYAVFAGYNAAPGTATIAGTSSATVKRVIGRVDSTGVIDTSTSTTSFSGGNLRGIASTDGSNFWLTGSNTGVVYTTLGASNGGTIVSTSVTNTRVAGIYGGQLYLSSASGAFSGVNAVGTGLPTTTGNTTVLLSGLGSGTNASNYGFFFADLDASVPGVDTLYTADDGGTAGITKFSLVSGTWTSNGRISAPSSRGLTGVVSGGNVTLYATSNATSANTLVTFTDTSGYNGVFSGTFATRATAPANTAFRGVSVVPQAASSPPTVVSVSANKTNGTYGIGQVIPVQVIFSSAVSVTGTPQLKLETGANDAVLDYVTGSGTDTLVFNYTVTSGDASPDLDYFDTASLTLNGGTIKNDSLVADLTLPAVGSANSLSGKKDLVIDGVRPLVSSVSGTSANTTYIVGQSIDVTVNFTETVFVAGGIPSLTLETGSTDRTVSYQSGSGTSTLTFRYTVQNGDVSPDLDYVSTGSLQLNGATIKDGAGNDSAASGDPVLPVPGTANSLSAIRNYVVDGIIPTVTNVAATSLNGTYIFGQVVDIAVSFTEPVSFTGSPTLLLETGATDRTAAYQSGIGTDTLVFRYTVQDGDENPDLNYVNTSSLSGSITDIAGNPATLTLPATGGAGSLGTNSAILVDGFRPHVTSVAAAAADGTYAIGQILALTVTFDQAVFVTGGPPQLLLETGATDRAANFVSGSATNVLTFNYTVQPGDVAADLDYVSTSSLGLSGGTILDANGNIALLGLASPGSAGSLGANADIVIDGTRPTITNVTSAASGNYLAGATIDITVAFSEVVNVFGSPSLLLETGSVDRSAVYQSGTGSNVLTFRYVVQPGDNAPDLDYVGTGSLTGGTIQDEAGNAADRTLPAPGAAGSLSANRNITVDAVVPAVLSVSSTNADQPWGRSRLITLTVLFSEPVNVVSGTPTILLETGTTDRTATYSSGAGTATLLFQYTVQAGDQSPDLDYTSTSALSGTIADAAGNAATLTLPAPGAAGSLGANKDLIVDGILPVITNVTSPDPDGSYKLGDVITITVEFSEPVFVFDIPILPLNTTPLAMLAEYSSGSGTNTLTFLYTVGAGDQSGDLDYFGSPPVLDGTIGDAAFNPDDPHLPPMGAPGSLGFNKNIVVDGTAPTMTGFIPNDTTPTNAATVSWTLLFSDPAVGVDTAVSNGEIFLAPGGGVVPGSLSVSGGGTSWTITANTGTGDGTLGLDILNIGTIKDLNGNPLASPPNISGPIYNIDKTAPTVFVLQDPAQSDPASLQPITFLVVFSEPVSGFGSNFITLSGTAIRGNESLSSNNPSGDQKTFVVEVFDLVADGTVTVSVAANVVQDYAGNGNAASVPADDTVLYETSSPSVEYIAPIGIGTTNQVTAQFFVRFSEPVSGVDVVGFTNFTLTMIGGVSGASIASITQDADPRFYTITVNTGAGEGELRLDLTSTAGIMDAVGNPLVAAAAGDVNLVVDLTPPTASFESTPALRNTPLTSILINFSEYVSTPSISDFSLTRGGVPVSLNGASLTDYYIGVFFSIDGLDAATTADGDYVLTFHGTTSAVTDDAGNPVSNDASVSFTVDSTGPTATLSEPTSGPTNAATLNFTVTLSEPVLGLVQGNFGIATTGSISGAAVTGFAPTADPLVYTVAVNPGVGVGTIQLVVSNTPAITDLAGNSPADFPATSGTVSIDTVAPAVTIDDGDTDNFVKAGTLNYTVDVSDANPGSFTISAANMSNDGTATVFFGTVTSVPITGGTRFTIPITTLSEGTIILRINSGASLTDLAGNSVSFPVLDNDTITIDTTQPSVSVNPAPGQSLFTNTQPVQFAVSFSEPVVGFGIGSFTLTGTAGNAAGASRVVTNPTADNQNFIVTVSSLTGDGTLTLTVPAGAVTDIVGNSNTISTGSDTVTLDIIAPVVTGITRFNPAATSTNAPQVVFQVTFSDPVTGVDATDFFLTTTGLAGATVGTVSGSNSTWFVTVNTGSGEGTIRLNVTDNDSIRDAASNRLGGPGANNGNFSAGESYTVDRTLPSVTSMTRLDPTITNLGTVRWLVTFNEPVQVSTVSGADFIPFASGVTFGAVSATQVHAGTSDNQFIVTVSGVVGTGSLGLNVSGGSATILDLSGNSLGQSFGGPVYTIDQTAPGVLVNRAAGQPALATVQPLKFQILFSEPIGTFGAAQITRSGSAGGLAGATIVVTNPSADLKTFAVTVSGLTGDGTVTLAVPAGAVTDTAGNLNTASGVSNDTITLDTTPPAVSIPDLDPLSDSGISQTDNITNDTTPTFSGTAEAGSTIVLLAGGNVLGTTTAAGGTWTITTLALPEGVYNVKARALDAAGNAAESTFIPVTIDTTGPTAVVTRAAGQPPTITVGAGGASVQFSIVFSQDIAGLTASDLSVGGTAGGTISNVSGSGAAYLVTVGSLTQPGTVTVNVQASVGVDLAGNAGTASPAGEFVTANYITQTQVLIDPLSITASGSATAAAFVTAPAGTVPTGSILFSLNGPGGIVTRTVSLSAGSASTTFTSLLAGNFTVTAAYQPDAGYVASAGGAAFTVAPGSGGGGGGGGGSVVDANAIGEYVAVAGRTVIVYNPDGTVKRSFQPFSASDAPGGVRAVVADLNGDGTPDIAVVTGPGAPARLRVFDGITTGLLYARTLFEGFPGGAFVVAGDLTGDDKADLAVTPDRGGGSRVTILNGPDGAVLTNFLGIDDARFRGGIRAAIGDLNNDGINDVLVAAGFGGGPRVAGFDGATLFSTGAKLFPDFFLFEPNLRNGAYVSVGDLNGDGWGDIIGGSGPGGAPRVLVYDSKALIQNHYFAPLANFYAGNSGFRGGIRVAAKDYDGDGHSDLVTGSGNNGQMLVFFGVDLLAGDTHAARESMLGGVIDGVYVG